MTTNVNTNGVVFNDATTQNTSSAYISTTFTANSTWTPAKPGLKAVRVSMLGGGGNGGTARGNTQPAVPAQGKAPAQPSVARTGAGGSGGGGGYSQAWVNGSAVPASVTVTVGVAAGTSSFGSLVSATGGQNGASATATTGANATGAGGTAGSGTTTAGPTTDVQYDANGESGSAGNSVGGTGAGIRIGNGGSAGGGNASGLGNGGGGSTATGAGSVQPGGTGSSGYVIVEEFY